MVAGFQRKIEEAWHKMFINGVFSTQKLHKYTTMHRCKNMLFDWRTNTHKNKIWSNEYSRSRHQDIQLSSDCLGFFPSSLSKFLFFVRFNKMQPVYCRMSNIVELRDGQRKTRKKWCQVITNQNIIRSKQCIY